MRHGSVVEYGTILTRPVTDAIVFDMAYVSVVSHDLPWILFPSVPPKIKLERLLCSKLLLLESNVRSEQLVSYSIQPSTTNGSSDALISLQ